MKPTPFRPRSFDLPAIDLSDFICIGSLALVRRTSLLSATTERHHFFDEWRIAVERIGEPAIRTPWMTKEEAEKIMADLLAQLGE